MALPLNPKQIEIGRLSPEQNEKVINHLIQKWGNGDKNGLPICEMCKTPADWAVGIHIVSPIVIVNNAFHLGAVIHPVIPVMCTNCGNTHYVNATVIGLVEKVEMPPPTGGTPTNG
jgi:hypothetical protein